MDHLLVENDLAILKKTIKSFVKEHVAVLDYSEKEYMKEYTEDAVALLQKKAGEAGLNALGAKKEWGGAGLSLHEKTIVYEEAAQHRLGLYHPAGNAFGEEWPNFLEQCTPQQVESYVRPAVQKGKGCFIALWENQEDNDIEKLTCTAVKDGDDWVLNGQKSYIQKMDRADFGVILVNCIDDQGVNQPTLFILDKNDSYETKKTTLIDVQNTHEVILKDLHVSDTRRIGKVGDGKKLMNQWLAEAQILLSARCLGVASKALQYAKEYAGLRITRGKPLSEFPSIRTKIANGIVNLKAARLMVRDAATQVDQGNKEAEHAAQMAKLFATETASKIIDDALQIHGGAGFAGDLPIERWYKEIRVARLDLQKRETIIENVAGEYI